MYETLYNLLDFFHFRSTGQYGNMAFAILILLNADRELCALQDILGELLQAIGSHQEGVVLKTAFLA